LLGEAPVDVQGEFQRWEGAGGFDPVAGAVGQAGQNVVDHRLVRAGGRQVDWFLAVGGVLGEGGQAQARPCPVNPARIAYSSTPLAKVARQPPRTSYGRGISDELVHRANAFW